MEGQNLENPQQFQPPPGMAEQVEDESGAGEHSTELEDYPPLAAPGATAKDWDESLLQNCTAVRLRSIARQYEGVPSKLNKPEMYMAIYNAMVEDQECPVCTGGNCDPTTHYFPALEHPPPGWVRGPDGIFIKPALPPRSETLSSSTPRTPTITTSAPVNPLQDHPPGTSQAGVHPGVQQQVTPDPRLRNTGSPSAGIMRPSNTPDIPVAATVSSFLPGVYQAPPTPRDPAQFVIRGAAAAAAFTTSSAQSFQPPAPPRSAVSSITSNPPQLPLVDAVSLERTRREIAEAKIRRQQETEEANRLIALQQQQQNINSQLALQQHQLLEAERAEEMAHQERMKQLRAGHASATASHLLTPQPFPQNSFFAPTTPAPIRHPGISPLANHSGPPAFIPPPTRHQFSPVVSPAHSNPSMAFNASPHSHLSPAAPAPVSPLPVTPEQLQQMIVQQVQAMAASNNTPHCHSHGASQICADHGKLKTNKVVNTDMAARFGVFATPSFEIDGDIESGDISKMRKVMTAGRAVAPPYQLSSATHPPPHTPVVHPHPKNTSYNNFNGT